MDSATLTAVILVFIACLGLYFATALPPPPPAPVRPMMPAARAHPVLAVRPAVLRQNVAVARLLR